MLLAPRKTKYRKSQKGRMRGIETRGTKISFGDFALKSMESKWISGRQIEAARRAIIRYLKKGGKLWIRIFPHKPITTKGGEAKMGHGKGSVDYYVYPIKPGRIIFELGNIAEKIAKQAFRKASSKLPIKTKIIKK